jgi:hypothetical protein
MFIPEVRAGYTTDHVSLEIAIPEGGLSCIFPMGSSSGEMSFRSGAHNYFLADDGSKIHDL